MTMIWVLTNPQAEARSGDYSSGEGVVPSTTQTFWAGGRGGGLVGEGSKQSLQVSQRTDCIHT